MPSIAHGKGRFSLPKRIVSIPFGMTEYGPSKYWLTNSRAASETAIRPSSRPSTKDMYGLKALYHGFEKR